MDMFNVYFCKVTLVQLLIQLRFNLKGLLTVNSNPAYLFQQMTPASVKGS